MYNRVEKVYGFILVVLFSTVLSMTACTHMVVPKTVNQVQVVTYSQITSAATQANAAYTAGIISAETHKAIHGKLSTVMSMMGDEQGIVQSAKLLSEVLELL